MPRNFAPPALSLLAVLLPMALGAQGGGMVPTRLYEEIDRRAAAVEGKVVAWRRDIHEHPELSNKIGRAHV